MKILYLSHKVITFILNEVVALKELGHDVSILTPHNDKNVFNNIVKPFIIDNNLDNVIHFNYRLSKQQSKKTRLINFFRLAGRDFINRPVVTLRYISFMPIYYNRIATGIEDYFDLRLLLDKQFDVLYSSFSTPSIIDKIYFLSKVLKVPFCLAFRAHDMYEDDNLPEIFKRDKKIKKASAFVTISKYNSEYAKKHFIGDRGVQVIHSAVDLDFFSRKEIKKKRPNSIIAVGRFNEQKGFIYLVRACNILANRNVPFNCILIGRGPEEKTYREEIREMNIPNISIKNYLDREGVRLELSQAGIFVLPCIVAKNGLRDILPNVLKEAMAMELPVVTSDVSGIDELVDDGCNGILTPPENPMAIADALVRLLSDDMLRREMGTKGREKVEKEFNIAIEARKLERLFLAISKNPKGAFDRE